MTRFQSYKDGMLTLFKVTFTSLIQLHNQNKLNLLYIMY